MRNHVRDFPDYDRINITRGEKKTFALFFVCELTICYFNVTDMRTSVCPR